MPVAPPRTIDRSLLRRHAGYTVFIYDDDPNGVILSKPAALCFRPTTEQLYIKTGDLSFTDWREISLVGEDAQTYRTGTYTKALDHIVTFVVPPTAPVWATFPNILSIRLENLTNPPVETGLSILNSFPLTPDGLSIGVELLGEETLDDQHRIIITFRQQPALALTNAPTPP